MEKLMRQTALNLSVFFIVALTAFTSAQVMKKEAVQPFNDGLKKSLAGDYKEALADFQTALAADKDYRIYYQIGFAQMKLNNMDEAIKNFNSSIAANPEFDAAYDDLGNVYYSQGKYQDAINNFEKVLSTSSNNSLKSTAKFNLALCYTQLAYAAEANKDYKQAISDLNKAVGYDNYDAAYFALSRNYVENKQYNDAIGAAQKALKYRKQISETGPDYYLGIGYSQKGEMKKAAEYLKKAEKDSVYKTDAEIVLKAIQK
jgi:tetratricopeptide (TPR) repeat protein